MNTLKTRDIEKLWNLFESLITKVDEDDKIKNLFNEKFGQRFIESSFSLRTNEPFCGIGGLLEYSLELAKNAKKINDIFFGLDNKKVLKISLISSLGRIGNEKFNRFKEYNSQWHNEKLGQFYEWNPLVSKYKVSEMTLNLLINSDIKLDLDEITTILLLDDFGERKQFYNHEKPKLASCLIMANDIVIDNEMKIIKEQGFREF